MAYAPVLTAQQIDRIRPFAKARAVSSGEILYNPGDDTPPVFVVIRGRIQIAAISGPQEQIVTIYGSGQFSGELLIISGRRSVYRCQAIETGELLQLNARELREVIGRDSELNDIFMETFLTRRVSLRAASHSNVVILGSRHSARTLALREFLTRDGSPFTYLDLDIDSTAQEFLDRFGVGINDVPIVVCNNRKVLRNPSTKELADSLGFNNNIQDSRVRDLVVVGAGPAGLSAAVYAASEGIDVLVIEKSAPGGQAGASSKIENYLGFPTGLSGHELASRAIAQAEKFGARIMVAQDVVKLKCERRPYKVVLDDGQAISARVIVLATGAQYNKPPIGNLDLFTGRGVYYNATFMEAQGCLGEQVIVIGGGNSAGQAAVFLAQHVAGVQMLVRSEELTETMSRYLIQRIEENPAIRIHYCSELSTVNGTDRLEEVSWLNKRSQVTTKEPIKHIFIMAGASPRTEWLAGCAALDDKGFVLSGRDVLGKDLPVPWPLARPPHMLESSLPGVFVVGDARSGNVKRVASAVGEGSMVLNFVHEALAEP
jgi:thioredoxin reductase (NADPH)